jgi:hypothetical protein
MKSRGLLVLLTVAAALVAACGFGLDPARDTSGATVRIAFASLPSDGPLNSGLSASGSSIDASARAVMPSGFLYLRTITASSSDEGVFLGPFPASAGADCVITGVAPGLYESLLILHSAKDLEVGAPLFTYEGATMSFRGLMSLPDAEFVAYIDAEGNKEDLDAWLGGETCAGEIGNVTIVEGTENRLSATLSPITSINNHVPLYSANTYVFSSPGATKRAYYALAGIQVSLPVTSGTLTCTIKAENASAGTLANAAFYSESGILVPTVRTGSDLVSGYTWTISASDLNSLAESDGSIYLFQYLDFSGTVTAYYENTAMGLPIIVSTSMAALAGKNVFLGLYDQAAYDAMLSGVPWQIVPPLAVTSVQLDPSTGDGLGSFPITPVVGQTYYYSAQIDMQGKYAHLVGQTSIDISEMIPYRGDYVTVGEYGLVPYTQSTGSKVFIFDTNFELYDDYVFFADTAGTGDGLTPTTPKGLAALMIDVNSIPVANSAQIYLVGDVDGITQNAGGYIGRNVSITTYGSSVYRIRPPTELNSFSVFMIPSGYGLHLTQVVIDASAVTVSTSSLIRNLGSFIMSHGTGLIGSSSQSTPTGGGIYSMGSLDVIGATISGCRSVQLGGAIYVAGGTATIANNSVLDGNVSGNGGSAVYVADGAGCSVQDSTVSNNVSAAGGYALEKSTGATSAVAASVTYVGNVPGNSNF